MGLASAASVVRGRVGVVTLTVWATRFGATTGAADPWYAGSEGGTYPPPAGGAGCAGGWETGAGAGGGGAGADAGGCRKSSVNMRGFCT
jgi:hypothetical protein